ncbi:unnamed protein product [Symbiodinium microadriaticum]|nr:unnamed protein product [Symbiodinium microadriaticum]
MQLALAPILRYRRYLAERNEIRPPDGGGYCKVDKVPPPRVFECAVGGAAKGKDGGPSRLPQVDQLVIASSYNENMDLLKNKMLQWPRRKKMQRNKAASSMDDPFDGDLDVPDYDEIERELFESEDEDEPVDREPAVDEEPDPPADDVECLSSSEVEQVQLVCILFDDKLICESALLPCPSNNILHPCGVPMRPVTMSAAEKLEELQKLSATWGDMSRFTPSEVGDLMDATASATETKAYGTDPIELESSDEAAEEADAQTLTMVAAERAFVHQAPTVDDKAKKGPKGMKPKPKKKVIKPSKAPLKAPRKDEKKDPGKDEKKDEKDDEKMDEKEDEKKDEQPGTVFAGRWAPAFPPASFRFEAAREAYEQ